MRQVLYRLGWALSLIALLGSPTFGLAADDSPLAVSLTPLTRELTADADQTISGTLTIQNLGSASQSLTPIARDFVADPDVDGAPRFIDAASLPAGQALSQWVTFGTDTLSVPANGTVSFDYTIHVPNDATPGGHFGAIFASSQSSSPITGSGASVSGSVGSLVLITVNGPVTVSGESRGLVALDSHGVRRSIFQTTPIDLKFTVSNGGTVHLVPSGTLTVTKRGTLVDTLTLNPDGGRVLPSSQRTFTTALQDGRKIGYGPLTVTAAAILTAPDGQTIPITAATSFWILPLTTMLWVFLLIIGFTLLFHWWLRRHDARIRGRSNRR